MAPSRTLVPESDPPSQADTPMTDAIDEPVARIPVDAADTPMAVRFDTTLAITNCSA